MKLVLYIFLCFSLDTIKSQAEVEIDDEKKYFDILLDYQTKWSSSTDPIFEVNEETTSNSVDIKDLSYISKLPTPVIIDVESKIDEIRNSCLFSIEDEKVRLALCFTPMGPREVTTTLISSNFPGETIDYYFELFPLGKWTRNIFVVSEDFIKLYSYDDYAGECNEINQYDWPENSIKELFLLPQDAHINIGRMKSKKKDTFKGAVKTIKIYYNTTISSVCEDFKLPASLAEDKDFREPPTGEKGEKGEKGDMGLKGEPGNSIQGPKGPRGPEGPRGIPGMLGRTGEKGECQCTKSVVSRFLEEIPEMRGPRGETGLPGDTGDPGPVGKTGKSGEQGERGPAGLKGEPGAQGDNGNPGSEGPPGPKGEPGKDGKPGTQGVQGIQGPPGPPGIIPKDTESKIPVAGPKGELGPIGPPGTPGTQGVQGKKGEKGHQGEKGEKGTQGATGNTGPRGEKGDDGKPGIDGASGIPGTHGKHGEKGEKGAIGDIGMTGPPGMPAKLSSILTSEVDPYEKEEIVELLRGIKGDEGPRGEKGDKGEIGIKGDPGIPGKDGSHGRHGAKGEPGLTGKDGKVGPAGPKGEIGPSGPPGLPSNIDTSLLKGADGKPGPPGSPGKPGKAGPKGNTGSRGPAGAKGPKGNSGATGPAGPIGSPGQNGTRGEKGEKGESAPKIDLYKLKGDKGEMGRDGKTGPPGSPGLNASCTCPEAKFVSGAPGPQGPPGPPGIPGTSIVGPKGEPGGIVADNTLASFADDPFINAFDDQDYYTANTMIFKSSIGLIKRTESTRLGTLAYILQEKILLLRVDEGWRYVAVGSILNINTKDEIFPTTKRNIPEHDVTVPTKKPLYYGEYYPVPKNKISRSEPYMVSPLEPSSAPVPKKRNEIRLAALNEPRTGNFWEHNGLKTVEHLCMTQAKILPNTYPFPSRNGLYIPYKVPSKWRHLPVTNTKGDVIFDSWIQMFDGSGAVMRPKSRILSFDGKDVLIDPTWPIKAVWHGSHRNGSLREDRSCNTWQSNSPRDDGLASNLYTGKLLDQQLYSCDAKLIVLCISTMDNNSKHPERRHIRSKSRRRARHYLNRTSPHIYRPPRS